MPTTQAEEERAIPLPIRGWNSIDAAMWAKLTKLKHLKNEEGKVVKINKLRVVVSVG